MSSYCNHPDCYKKRLSPRNTTGVCAIHLHGPTCLCDRCVERRNRPPVTERLGIPIRSATVRIPSSTSTIMQFETVTLPKEPWAPC